MERTRKANGKIEYLTVVPNLETTRIPPTVLIAVTDPGRCSALRRQVQCVPAEVGNTVKGYLVIVMLIPATLGGARDEE